MDQLEHHRRCVLCVKHFTHPKATCANTPVKPHHSKATCASTSIQLSNHVIICSAATDGQLLLWDITVVLHTWLNCVLGCSIENNEVCPVVPLCVVQCHQSGINDMDIKCMPGDVTDCTPCSVDKFQLLMLK